MIDVVICGDGSIQPFAENTISLAKENSSNYLVCLQAEWADKLSPKLIVIQAAPVDRVEWVDERKSKKKHWFQSSLIYSALNINYTALDPGYNEMSVVKGFKPFLESSPIDSIESNCIGQPDVRDALIAYRDNIFDKPIKQHYDMGLLFKLVSTLSTQWCVVLNNDVQELASLIPPNRVVRSQNDLQDHIRAFKLL